MAQSRSFMPRSLLRLLTIVSLAFASPLNNVNRRQIIETVTVSVTSTLSAASFSSQPIIPIIPTALPPETITGIPSGLVTASPVSNSSVSITAHSLPGTIVIPITPPSAPTPTGLPAEDPCQVVCKTDKISISTCLQNCQIINGKAQLNAPGVLFPPEVPTTLVTSTTASTATTSTSTSSLPTANPISPTAPASTDPLTVVSSDEEDGVPLYLPLPNVVTEEEMASVANFCQKMCRHQIDYVSCIGKCEIERLSAK
ncbi:MAG: hypothetical protein Q9218_003004 [Villophora microphyllina]